MGLLLPRDCPEEVGEPFWPLTNQFPLSSTTPKAGFMRNSPPCTWLQPLQNMLFKRDSCLALARNAAMPLKKMLFGIMLIHHPFATVFLEISVISSPFQGRKKNPTLATMGTRQGKATAQAPWYYEYVASAGTLLL